MKKPVRVILVSIAAFVGLLAPFYVGSVAFATTDIQTWTHEARAFVGFASLVLSFVSGYMAYSVLKQGGSE